MHEETAAPVLAALDAIEGADGASIPLWVSRSDLANLVGRPCGAAPRGPDLDYVIALHLCVGAVAHPDRDGAVLCGVDGLFAFKDAFGAASHGRLRFSRDGLAVALCERRSWGLAGVGTLREGSAARGVEVGREASRAAAVASYRPSLSLVR